MTNSDAEMKAVERAPTESVELADDAPRSKLLGSNAIVRHCVAIARRGLPSMFDRKERLFAFSRKRQNGSMKLVGSSLRYSCIVLLGARLLSGEEQRAIFDGSTAEEYCLELSCRFNESSNLGDLALFVWAAADLRVLQEVRAIPLLCTRVRDEPLVKTVELAWAVSAFVASVEMVSFDHDDLGEAVARLKRAFSAAGCLFRHWVDHQNAPWYRSHVGCFADQVYPIQALARFHRVCDDSEALQIATQCAHQIVSVQGSSGQWWWHYDTRTGRVVEGYPVYTVHQDSMAPMALFDLRDAGGPCYAHAIEHGLNWLESAAEIRESLLDDDVSVIWRSVKRTDPAKLLRRLRAPMSRIAGSVRVRLLDSIFRPSRIDREDRPYHLAWILYAWLSGSRVR